MSDAADFSRLGAGTWTVEPEMVQETQVRAERLQLAREVHDVVASGFAVVSLQAALAAHVLEEHPERAREAMAEIRRISTSALHELRSILDVVRTAEPGALGRASGVAGIAALASVTTKAGVLTRLTVSGRRRLLPSDVDLAAYRIVQESLTNVLRHSGAASASVLIAYEDDRLLVEVDDDGIGAAGPTNLGHGILGMRERASALGGEIEAGPHPQGGYRVRATLPLRGGR